MFDLPTALLLFLVATVLLAAAEWRMPKNESADGAGHEKSSETS